MTEIYKFINGLPPPIMVKTVKKKRLSKLFKKPKIINNYAGFYVTMTHALLGFCFLSLTWNKISLLKFFCNPSSLLISLKNLVTDRNPSIGA